MPTTLAQPRAPWHSEQHRGDPPEVLAARYGYRTAPIPVRDLVRDLGIHLSEVQSPGWSGASRHHDNGEGYIWVRADEIEPRKRFTIAHELGHLLLHLTEPGMELRSVAGMERNWKERQADQFAADLLMPMALLEPWAEKLGWRNDALARKFKVSKSAMEWRLTVLLKRRR